MMAETFSAELSAWKMVELAGKTLVALSKNASIDMVKTGLLEDEERILEECFTRGYGQEGFAMYHVEAVWTAIQTANTQLVHVLLEKDVSQKLLVGQPHALQALVYSYYTKSRMTEVLEIARLLVSHGAKVNTFDPSGNTPTYYTCIYGHPQSFQFFKACGADWTTMHNPPCSEWPFVPDPGPEKVDLLRVTVHALHTSFAVQQSYSAETYAGWILIILSLVNAGFKVVFTDPGSATLLKVLCYDGHLDHLIVILEHSLGRDVEGRLAEEDAAHLAPGLHVAAHRAHTALVLYLLKLGVPPDSECVTTLQELALRFDSPELLRWLTEHHHPIQPVSVPAESTSPCRTVWCPKTPQSLQNLSSNPVCFGGGERYPSSDSLSFIDYGCEDEPQRTHIPLPMPRSAANTAHLELRYWDLNDPYEIRVLILEPSPDINAPVKCQLESAHLAEDAAGYEALSYVWGNASDKVLIWVQDTQFPATRNLWEALCRLRLPDQSRVLWVDAVCINQANTVEKNKQVQLMRHIYQSAKRTLIWVGEEADDSHLLYEHVSKWKRQCERDGVEPSIEDNSPPSYDERTERAFLTFCHRPWFYRTWIIQEKALSKEAIVVCGQDAEEWSLLFHQEVSSVENVMDVLLGIDGPTHIENLGLMSTPLTEEAIQHSRICDCKEPKDKVYALLGLLNRPLITVDYNLTTETVYAMFTQAVIQQERNLKILHLMGSHKRLQALPSWVPDFSIVRPVDILPEPPQRHPSAVSHALVNVSPRLRFSGFEMTLGGCPLETIKSVADELLADKANCPGSAAFSETMRKWESLAVELQHHRSSRSICEAFHRTLMAQHGFGPLSDPKEQHSRYPPPPHWVAWYNFFGSGVLRWFDSEYFRELEEIVEREGAAYQETEKESDIDKYTMAIKRACYGRSFFITDNGSMGLAPPGVAPGDIIVYLQGGVHPFVLRPNWESGHFLIGDCYLDNFNEHDFTLEDIESFGEVTLR